MSAPPIDPATPDILDEARLLCGILRRGAREDRPQARSDDLVRAADLLLELGAIVIVYRDQMVLMEDLHRQLGALRSLVERAKETGIDEDWRKEARVVLRASQAVDGGRWTVDGKGEEPSSARPPTTVHHPLLGDQGLLFDPGGGPGPYGGGS